jgi:predicted acetyltransferase
MRLRKPDRMTTLELVVPSEKYLASYLDAIQRGWSPDNIRGAEAAADEIAEIKQDPERFISQRADDREAKGGPVKMPDGSTVQRLPGFNRWLWDGEFCGSIGFRWQPGTAELPPHVLGHIGYSVVPWKRGRGYATIALAVMLNEARGEGLPYVELTTDSDNLASQKVILANGGKLIEEFRKPAQYGLARSGLRYRIMLSA